MKPVYHNLFTKMLRWKSIRVKFMIPSLVLLLATIGFIGFFLIQGAINSSHLIVKELQQHTLGQINDQLSQRLQAAMQLNQINYDSLRSGVLDLESDSMRERYFVNHIKSYPDVAMTYIGLTNGSFYGARRTADGQLQAVRNDSRTGGASWYYYTSGFGEGIVVMEEFPQFDPRTRPWYIKAAEAEEPTLSSIYSHFVFHEPTVTASYPVYGQNHQLIGVFGVDYLLSWLGDMLGDMPIGDSGQVFVTDDTGLLIASSFDSPANKTEEGTSQLIPVNDIDSELIQASLALPLDADQSDSSAFTVDGKKYYVSISNFQEYGANWKIYLILAEDDFLGQVKHAVRQTAAIMVISIFLSLLSTFWISGRITKPVVSLSRAAKELTCGRLIPIPDDGRADELGELNRSFKEMGLQLTRLVADLEGEVKMRTQELQERNEDLQRLSFSDSLTGIANRRKFDDTILNVWNSALRNQRPVSIMMLDIDFFKDYNDAYGHQAGDDCLKAIGALLSQKIRRASDLAARYGGEEFIIVTQDSAAEKTVAFAEEIRAGIEGLCIEHEISPYKKVTVSIGCVHAAPTPEATPAALIELADRALYQAKENGRNHVILSGAKSEDQS